MRFSAHVAQFRPQPEPSPASSAQPNSLLAIPTISSCFACASSVRFFGERKNARARSSAGTGHSHPQNARPTTSTNRPITTSDTTARGTTVFAAIIVVSAPSGHRAEMVSHPKPDIVPKPMPATNPMDSTANAATAIAVRRFLVFITAPYSADSVGLTTMARSVAPDAMEPAFSDTHTLSHAPQPLHFSGSTATRGLLDSPVSSMASYGHAS